ncbi:MAG: sigma-70 family RNA polymerase sigma factor [Pseudomonadota bacterium]
MKKLKTKPKTRDLKREFEELAMPHQDALLRVALKMTGSMEEAEDLVQETFLKAFRSFDRFEWGTNIKAWMFRIMINTHYNIHRHKKIYRDIEESSHGHWINMEVVSQESMRALRDPQSMIQRGLVAKEIQTAVDGLSEEYRVIFMLADVEGFSYKEVAATVGCPIGTVMSRLHRARRMLQVALLGKEAFRPDENVTDETDQDETNVTDLRQYRRSNNF